MKLIQRCMETTVRNWKTTLPAIFVIAITLSLFHGLLVIHDRAERTLENIQQKFSFTVYFKDEADIFAITTLITELEKRSDVISPVTYTSKDDAWKLINKTFSLDDELAKKYRFSLPASITVTPRSPDDTAQLQRYIRDTAGTLVKNSAATGTNQDKITEQMVSFIHTVKDATLGTLVLFMFFFIGGAAFLIASAIHLAINTRRSEIAVMKLMGASYGTITAPFIYEGVIMSACAFVLHLIFLMILPVSAMNSLFFKNALLGELIVTVGLGLLVSYIATRIYLRYY